MAKYQLFYWNIRGLAEHIRMMLEYAGAEWEDGYYECGPAPDFDKSCWFDVKHKLGLPFPNLPYLIHGDLKITQTLAITHYLARQFELTGKTQEEKVRADNAAAANSDVRAFITSHVYNPEFEKLKEKFVVQLKEKMEQFSIFLGKNTWFAGETLTFADFFIYETLYIVRKIDSASVESFDNLIKFMDRFEKLPKIADYIKTEKYKKMAFNNKMAKWGNEENK